VFVAQADRIESSGVVGMTMSLQGLEASWLLLALDWLIRLVALFWIPARTHPGAARSWLLLVGFVPLLGLPAYLLFGHPWLSRQRIQRQADVSQVIREQQGSLQPLRWPPPPGVPVAEIAPLVERLGRPGTRHPASLVGVTL